MFAIVRWLVGNTLCQTLLLFALLTWLGKRGGCGPRGSGKAWAARGLAYNVGPGSFCKCAKSRGCQWLAFKLGVPNPGWGQKFGVGWGFWKGVAVQKTALKHRPTLVSCGGASLQQRFFLGAVRRPCSHAHQLWPKGPGEKPQVGAGDAFWPRGPVGIV